MVAAWVKITLDDGWPESSKEQVTQVYVKKRYEISMQKSVINYKYLGERAMTTIEHVVADHQKGERGKMSRCQEQK